MTGPLVTEELLDKMYEGEVRLSSGRVAIVRLPMRCNNEDFEELTLAIRDSIVPDILKILSGAAGPLLVLPDAARRPGVFEVNRKGRRRK